MKTLQFEAVKVALKQDKTGYVLTLCMHPDEIPEDLLRDFVGARYQVVMVRLGDNDLPMRREDEFAGDQAIKMAGLLSRDPTFWHFLHDTGEIIEQEEKEATDWLRERLGVASRKELKNNMEARVSLYAVNQEFNKWKQGS